MMTLDADNGVSLMSGASVEEFSTDGTMGGDSDEAVPTEKAVKTYVDRIPNLVSEPTGFPNRTDSTITMGVGAPNRFTIAPVITSFDYYIKGVQYTVSAADSLDISEDQGLHYIYYDGGVLTESLVFDINFLKDKAYVAVTYWDSSSNIHIYLGDERHGLVMDWATHAYLHRTRGTVWSSGLPLTDIVADGTGNLNIDAQLGYSQGVIYDEDIQLTIPEMAAPANVRVFYQYGSTGTWRIKTANDFPVLEGGSTPDYAGTRLAYNEFTGGAWTLTEVVDDGYVLMHFFATNDLTQGVIAVVGQNEYTTLGDAHDAAKVELDSLILTDLPFVEFTAIATTINKTSDSFTNTPQSAIVSTDTGSDYVDWRGVQGQSRGSVAVSDHGNLTGLGNDDHIQYSLVAGSRPFIAPVSGVDPTIGSHLATKDYVDGQIAGSVSHNSTTGIQGGDPGQNEFYHIDAEFFNIASADSTGLTIAGDVRCDDLYTTGDTIHVGSGEIKSSNGNISLYYNGIRVFETFASGPNNTGGINLYSDTESTLVRLLVDDDTDGFTIYTAADGGVTRIDGENSSSTYTRMAEFNPDGAVDLYHSGVKVVQTHRIAGTNAGIDLLDDSGNTHGAIRSNSATGNFLFANTINGGEIRLLADNTGGSQVSLAFFDPDEGVELYHTNTKVLQTIDITSQWGIEIGDLASSGATAAKTQFYQGGSTLFIKNNYHNGTIQIQGEDSGGTTTTLLQLKDQNSNMYHDNLIALQMQAGGFVARSTDGSNSLSFLAGNDGSGTIRNLKDDGYIMLQVDSSNPSLGLIQTVLRGDANGSTKIYHAGSQVFETDTTGVIITGSIQLLSGTSVDEISTDTTLAGNSDDAIPTQKAVKTYVDSFVAQETTNGIEPVLQGDSTAEISFDVAQVDENYSVVGNLVNELDNAPSIYGHIIRNKTKDGFTVLFSGPMDSANYKFDWITSRSEFESSSSSSSSSSRSSSSSSSSSSSAAIPVGARATDDDDIRVTDDDEIRIID